MWDRLSLVTAPTGKPVTIDDVKDQTRVDFGDEDGYLTALIDRVIAMIDGPQGIGYCMMQQTWRLALDTFLYGGTYPQNAPWSGLTSTPWAPSIAEIVLPLGPVVSVDSIKYLDLNGTQQTLDPSTYWTNLYRTPARINPAWNTYWPQHRPMPGSVIVQFTCGASDASGVPADLRHAVCQMVAQKYENREDILADYRVTVSQLPANFDTILARYRAGIVS